MRTLAANPDFERRRHERAKTGKVVALSGCLPTLPGLGPMQISRDIHDMMEIKGMPEIEGTVSNETRLFIGGVPKNVTNEMIIARFAAVPEIKVKEASRIYIHGDMYLLNIKSAYNTWH